MQIIVCKLVHLLLATGSSATKPKPGAVAGTAKMLRHAGRIMKLTAILILGACLQIHATGLGQGITLTVKDAPLESVFKQVQKQTDYKFLYTSQLLEGAAKVSLSVKNAGVKDVLDVCFKDQKLDYEINDNMIVVRPRKDVGNKEATRPIMKDPIEVRGIITDENGSPVHGVNIVIKGTSKGTTTNLRGEFVLRNVIENAVLLVTSVGYDRQEIIVKSKELISLKLKVAVGNLDEMQVIGYGKTTKRLNTGNVSTLKGTEIEKQPINNPLLALEGRVPGLFITQNTGIPGGGITVRIQGINSISRGSDPLVIIDGVPYITQMLPNLSGAFGILGGNGNNNPTYAPGGGGNPLSFINPADIESIDILKDADATSIYGSRAAAGAILITTKKGKPGTKLDINFQNGWGKMTRKLDLLNTQQYLEMRREAINNDGGIPNPNLDYDLTFWDTTRYTDWQKVLLGGTANYTDAQGSVSGGTINTNFLVGAGFHRETSIFPGDLSDEKGSIHFNINHSSQNQKLKFQLSGNYLVDNNQLINNDLTLTAIRLSPNAPNVYNSDGTLNWAQLPNGNSTWFNPLNYLYRKYKSKTSNLLSSALISYKITPNFEIKSNLGYTDMQIKEYSISPLISFAPELRPNSNRSSSFINTSINSWILEPQMIWKKEIGRGMLETLLGSTFYQAQNNLQRINANGFNNDAVLEDIRAAATLSIPTNGTIVSTYKYNAVFTRLNYNIENKYVINLTGRRDGSSRFGTQNLFHNFWALGTAWVFSNEKFIQKKLPFISFGKLRGSYGITGNDQIGDYQYLNLYNAVNMPVAYQNSTGLAPAGLPNPYLEWEETKKVQFGIDLGFINDRIFFSVNYYQNRSLNQLQGVALPIQTGNSSIQKNFSGVIQNFGWEFEINTTNFKKKNFFWSSSINLSVPKNKLISYPDLSTSLFANTYIIGQPITINRAYRFLGIDPSTGIYLISDVNGNPITSAGNSLTDRTVIINNSPKFYGGIQNNFSYRGFELNILIQFVKQVGANYILGNFPGRFSSDGNSLSLGANNQPVYVLQRWQKIGDITQFGRFSASYPSALNTAYNNASASDLTISDASYIRLKNVSFSWQLPINWKQKMHLRNCKLFIQGQNLFTITNYKGLDPESKSLNNVPPLKVLTLGFQVGI